MHAMQSLLSEFSSAFYQDDFEALSNLQSQISESLTKNPSLLSLCSSNLEFQKYLEDSAYYETVLTYLHNSDWQPVSNMNEISVESLSSGADFYTKASVLMYSSIIETISVINETDLLPLWIHALSNVELLNSASKLKKFMKYDFWFPWPLTNRECFIDFSAYPVPEEQSLLVIMRSPAGKYLDIEIPEADENVHRMTIPLGCLLIKSILPRMTQVTIMVQANSNADFKPSFLPEWLVEFGKKQMMYFLMDALRITVHNFEGSEYQNRVNQKAEFYGFLKKILGNYLDVGVLN